MVTHSNSIWLQQGIEDFFTVIKAVFWYVIALVVAVFVCLDVVLIYEEDKVKRIEKNLKLLEAIMEDHVKLVEEGKNVESVARRFWDAEDISGIHRRLENPETKWLESTENVVNEAKVCINNYNAHSRGSFLGSILAFRKWKHIRNVRHKIREVTSKMQNQLDEKYVVAKIYDFMEKSRSRNRSLLDQYTIEEKETDKSVAAQHQKHQKPSTSMDDLMKKNKDLYSSLEERWIIQLVLALRAFTKDLSQLNLETKTEKLWKRDAKELIEKAEVNISNFLWWVSKFSSIRILKKNNPVATHEFRKNMQRIATAFDDLLERKNSYKFNFIDRAGEKSKLTYQNADHHHAIQSALKSIHRKLNREGSSSENVAEIKSWCDELVKMNDELQQREETAVRDACLVQIKFVANEVIKSLDKLLVLEEEQIEYPELNQIRKAIDSLNKIIQICHIKRQDSTSVVGLKDDVRELVSKLTTSSDNHLILSIVGMIGVGKTTMAKAIFHDKAVVEHFPFRIWVTVTEGAFHGAQVLLMKQDGTKDRKLPINEVCKLLKGKLGLVVLDNVSKTDDFDKHNKELFSGMTNGSRMVLTTRFKNVASNADNRSTPHQIRLLTEEESWTLFQNVTYTQRHNLKDEEEKLARKVVTICGGLPFAILSVGCYISANGMNESELLWMLKQINHGLIKTRWRKAWEKSKHELSDISKECLNYFTLFPADFEIPTRRLVNLWAAEESVKHNKEIDDNKETPEENAVKALEELRDLNVIQVVTLKSSAKIKTSRLPSMLRDIILQDSNGRSQYSGTQLVRRFAYRFDDHGLDANSANVFSKKGIPLDVFFFDKREGSKPGEHVRKILSTGIASEQFMDIRVLDLEGVFRPQLPETLSKLIHLKYLGLRWTYLEELPSFIGKFQKLETLDVKHTCIRVLPRSIWKLKKLKNLYLNQNYRNRIDGKPSGNFQEYLHTLWGVFIYGSCPLLHEIYRLKNIRKLKLSFQLEETEQDTLSKMIARLDQLHSLSLKSIDESGDPIKLKLRNMSKLEKLTSIKLHGKLEDRLFLPPNLTALTLSASELSYDPMPELQKLSKLESLCFHAKSYKGDSMVCNPNSFPKLRVLRLWNLKNLHVLKVKEGAMSSLKEFESRSCIKLEFPTGLKHLMNLRTIKYHEMSDKFKQKMESTISSDVEIVNLSLSP